MIEGPGSGKNSSFFNLKDQQLDIDKSDLYVKDLCKAECQLWISKRESAGSKHFNDLKVFIKNSNGIYNNIGDTNQIKNVKV